jgi:hypothetical protein
MLKVPCNPKDDPKNFKIVTIKIESIRDSLNVMAKFEFNRLYWGYPLYSNKRQ